MNKKWIKILLEILKYAVTLLLGYLGGNGTLSALLMAVLLS